MSEEHLGEESFNMYLDGELSADERSDFEAHLVTCEACRAELKALQRLFTALERLDTAPAPVPDLVTGVLARVDARERASELRAWLIYALQGVAPLALLVLAWVQLGGYWTPVVNTLIPKAPGEVWTRALAWMTTQWTVFHAWSIETWTDAQGWRSHLSSLKGLSLSLSQVAVVGAALTALWLIGNAALLRHAKLNGQVTR